jgi:putative tryptophan/tyrosine transport system substrate-binding protein
MNRRGFIAGIGGAVAWPLTARAQQGPVIGLINNASLDASRLSVEMFHRGLSDLGFVEGSNVTIESRYAEDHSGRLPAMAVDLVRREVSVIAAFTTPAALAAKSATKSIPIVFSIGSDPIEAGLVASFSRPGGNLTGITTLSGAVVAKRLELLREVMPTAPLFAFLVNPGNQTFTRAETQELEAAAHILGVRLLILKASGPGEFEATFRALASERAGGLIVSGDPLFNLPPYQIVTLAARHKIPAIYDRRATASAGGLLSYGTDFPEGWRQVGNYVGRILKGEKPADLPVQQATKMELVINMKTAKTLGLMFPTGLLVRADEVIE